MKEADIIDTNDFLEQYSLSQCEADSLAEYLEKNNKKKVFDLLLENKVPQEKCEEYYKIMRKDFTKTFNIVEDNSYLKDDESFQKLEGNRFMFSTGSHVANGFLYRDKIMGANAAIYSRTDIKQIWIMKEI